MTLGLGDDDEDDPPLGDPRRRLAALVALAGGIVLLCLRLPEAAGGIAAATGVLVAFHPHNPRK